MSYDYSNKINNPKETSVTNDIGSQNTKSTGKELNSVEQKTSEVSQEVLDKSEKTELTSSKSLTDRNIEDIQELVQSQADYESNVPELDIDSMSTKELNDALENPNLSDEQMEKILERLDSIVAEKGEMEAQVDESLEEVIESTVAFQEDIKKGNQELSVLNQAYTFKTETIQVDTNTYNEVQQVQKEITFQLKKAIETALIRDPHNNVLRRVNVDSPLLQQTIQNAIRQEIEAKRLPMSFDDTSKTLFISKQEAHKYNVGDTIEIGEMNPNYDIDFDDEIESFTIENIYIYSDEEFEQVTNAFALKYGVDINEHKEKEKTHHTDQPQIRSQNEREETQDVKQKDKKDLQRDLGVALLKTGKSPEQIKKERLIRLSKELDQKAQIIKKEVLHREIINKSIKSDLKEAEVKNSELKEKEAKAPNGVVPPPPDAAR